MADYDELARLLAQYDDPTTVLRQSPRPFRVAPYEPGQQYLEQNHGVSANALMNARYGLAPLGDGRPKDWMNQERPGGSIAETTSPWAMAHGVGQAAGMAYKEGEAGNYGSAAGYGVLAGLGLGLGGKSVAPGLDAGFNAAYHAAYPVGRVGSMGGRPPNRPLGFWKSPDVQDFMSVNNDKSFGELYQMAREKYGDDLTYGHLHRVISDYYPDRVTQRRAYPPDFDQAVADGIKTKSTKEVAQDLKVPPSSVTMAIRRMRQDDPSIPSRIDYRRETAAQKITERDALAQEKANLKAQRKAERDEADKLAAARWQAIAEKKDTVWPKIRDMRMNGLSYSDIANELGRPYTRNAVAGTIKRMRENGVNVPAIAAGAYGLSQSPDHTVQDILNGYNPD